MQEEPESAGSSSNEQRRASVEECQERLKKQRVQEEERQNAWRKREEEQRLKQEEEQRRRAEDEVRLRELEEERCRRKLQEEAERRRMEEEKRRIREEEERRKREEEENRRIKEEEVRRQREEDERRRLEEQKRKEEEERRMREEEEEARREQELEAARKRKLREEEERLKKEEAQRLKELEQKKEAEERRKKEEEEEEKRRSKQAEVTSDPQERKRRAEELRWKEMEERQRPFSFKVSSGEKQILFQKVNLSPVTPSSGPDSPTLPAPPYVPHTAILVTGAQLCGTAVQLDQIKDSACKSLLGVGEDRKAQGTPPAKTKTSPDRKSDKSKSLSEASFSTEQSGSAVLAEWASIRSKIFRGVEEGKYDEYPEPSKNQPQPGSEDPPAFSHVSLRKTMSASAKFSITAAKKKFGDSNRNSEALGADDGEGGEDAPPFESPSSASSPASTTKPQNRTSKTVRIQERGPGECMFAKDLPSFLVPSHGAKSERVELKSRTGSETEASEGGAEEAGPGLDPEDNPSPFGIKLRRTNYSLRFHSEQSTEKRKKRYSAGDSFDGVPSPLTPIEPGGDLPSTFSDKSPPASPHKEGATGKYLPASASPAVPRAKPGKPSSSMTHSDGEKSLSKSLLYSRPATSPKPVGALPTPPPSPLPRVAHGPSADAALERSQQQQERTKEASVVEHPPRISHGQVQLEGEPKEKRSFFPSINIPWREKVDRKTELIRRGRLAPMSHIWP